MPKKKVGIRSGGAKQENVKCQQKYWNLKPKKLEYA